MRRTDFYIKTRRTVAKQESINAYLLEKAGFISQVAAGVYNFLPLAARSLQKIEQIVREEMNSIGANELLLSALHPKSTWEKAGRWNDPNFRSILYYDPDADMALAPTHEEPISDLVKSGIQSYRDLPVLLYQFQTKFRKELRAKSGLLRGREFRMKDMYSFHPDEASHNEFYEKSAQAYLRVFNRLGLDAYRTKASGGIFTDQLSDEFQVVCDTGEDEILVDHQKKIGFNREVEGQISEAEKKSLERVNAIEVGNIFHYGTKYSKAFGLEYSTVSGERSLAVTGAYGIGISRLLGTLAELNNDEHGLKLPAVIAPFQVVMIDLTESKTGEKLTQELEKNGIDVLYDDRDESAGTKLVEADLIGYPIRLVYSQKTAQEGKVEIKERFSGKVMMVKTEEIIIKIKELL